MYDHIKNIVCHMERIKTEEWSYKIGNREITVLLTDCKEDDKINQGQECAKSIPPEVGAHAGDSIIPALLKILPYDTIVEWKTNTGEWHTNMIHDINKKMIKSFPEKLRITYIPDAGLLTIGGC